jgi:hypothetical protein
VILNWSAMNQVIARLGVIGANQERPPKIRAFAKHLEEQLTRQEGDLDPDGFCRFLDTVMLDLRVGVESFTGSPLHGELVKQPPAYFADIMANLEDVIKGILPAKFAAEVCELLPEFEGLRLLMPNLPTPTEEQLSA